MAELTVIIVSYNARAHLGRCLGSLHTAPPAIEHEIVVVDNASTDGAPDEARRWPGVRVIESGANLGFAAGVNIGLRATNGRLVLLLNPDTEATPGAVDALVAALDADDGAAIAGPRIVDARGVPELSHGALPGLVSQARTKWLMRRMAAGDHRALAHARALTATACRTDWVTGAGLLVRRAEADAVGGLDEGYFLYFEDVDFCSAVRARGGRVLFTPTALFLHDRGASGAGRPAAAKQAYRASQRRFYERHHPRLMPLMRLYLRVRS